MRRLVILAAAAALLLIVPAAQAETVTVSFESGPALGTPVNDDYAGSASVRWLHFDEGFRPYRRSAPGQARSGSVVADVGADVCDEEAGPGVQCEIPVGGTSARLLRTASSVTLFAGLFSPASAPVTVRLVGHRANGTVAAAGPAVTLTTSFTTQVRIASAAADIVSFDLVVEGVGAGGAQVGFDDLTLDYPASSLPEISVSAPPGPVAVLQGKTTEVPVQLTRLNGSNGPAHLSVTGLPAGVTAQVVPAALPGTQGAATVRLTGAPGAPVFEVPRSVTIRADPQGNAGVAPAARTTGVLIRVGGNFSLVGTTAAVDVPTCATADVPFKLARDRAFTGTVALSAVGLPPGMTAEFLPGATIPPGGGFTVDATLRLRGGPAAAPPTKITVRAESAGAPARTLEVEVSRATPTAALETTVGLTPRHLAPGTELRVRGNGFCPGTLIRAGNEFAETPATVDPNGRGLTFRVPRLATTGPLTVLPPPGTGAYATTNVLTVRSFRNRFGFKFPNYGYGKLSIDELTDLVGADDLFIKVNPCWPFGTCEIVTGFLDPGAAIVWGVLNLQLRSGGGGHCLGMVRAAQELIGGRVKLNRFASVGSTWDIPATTGPGTEELKSYLDARQALQGTAEYMGAFVYRDRRVKSQVDLIEAELREGREPGVTLLDGHLSGHQVLAYDMEQRADGGLNILVYDPNRPFLASEDGSGPAHRTAEVVAGVIRVSADRTRWEFDINGGTWTGSGGDGSLIAMPLDFVPKELSLPGLGEISLLLNMVILGSVDGSVRTDGGSDGAEFMPVADSVVPPGSAGWVIGRRGAETVSHTVTGIKKGTYSQAVTGRGFVAAATDVPTAKGVRDRVSGTPESERVRFEALAGAPERPLELQLATQMKGESARSATIRTHTFGGGAETAALASGRALTYQHDGAPTAFSFTLDSVQRNAGPAAFASGQLRIGRGDRVTATPADWDELRRVRLVVRHRDGTRTTRMLRNRAKVRARVALSRPRVQGRKASVSARFAKLPRDVAAGLVLRVVDGDRTVARRALAVKRPRRGTRVFRWRLPKLATARYRLVARLAVSAGGPRAGTVRRTRAATFTVARPR